MTQANQYDSDTEEQDEEPEVEIRAYECGTCQKLVFLELVDDQRYRAATCPKCGDEPRWLKTDPQLSAFTTCIAPTCTMYLSTVATMTNRQCEGKRDKNRRTNCNREHATLTMADAELYIYDLDGSDYQDADPRPVRRLRARIAAAMSFVGSSGTHHASKSGPHTSSAREKHSKASGSKANVRRYYIGQLEDGITAVRSLSDGARTYATLLSRANEAVGAVRSK